MVTSVGSASRVPTAVRRGGGLGNPAGVLPDTHRNASFAREEETPRRLSGGFAV